MGQQTVLTDDVTLYFGTLGTNTRVFVTRQTHKNKNKKQNNKQINKRNQTKKTQQQLKLKRSSEQTQKRNT